jgi:hypothetical protein
LGELRVVLQDVRCEGGLFHAPGQHPDEALDPLRRASYAALTSLSMWDSAIEPSHVQAAHAVHDLISAEPAPLRPDVAAKVFGEFEYIHDRVMPGALHPMCHGMVFRPGTLSAEVIEHDMHALAVALNRTAGVLQVVRDGLLLGVLAETEHALSQIARKIEEDLALGKLWRCDAEVPDPLDVASWLKTQALETTVVADVTSNSDTDTAGDVDRRPAVHQRVVADFQRPFVQHASIGLCCALAQWTEQSLEVWTTAKAFTTCVVTWLWRLICLPNRCKSRTWKAPDVMATMAQMTWLGMPLGWRGRCPVAPCGCNGRAKPSWAMRLWPRPWRCASTLP